MFINKHNTINTDDTYNITKNNNLFNITDAQYFTKKNLNTSNITNNITRHNHNNYEHNVIKKVNKHITHVNNYDTEINYYSKKSLNKNNYYKFYNDYFNFRKIENISISQQSDITNNITKTNNQTITYVDNNYLNNNKIATIILNTVPELNENYLWIPEGITDNVVPGLDSILTYMQSKYATLTALQNSVTNINNTINNEIANTQTEINNIEITSSQNVSKDLHYHTSHTDFMYKRNTTKNDNRRSFIIQQNHFTFQRQYNTNNLELMIQFMQLQIDQMQTQINDLSSSNNPPDNNDPDGIGTM